MSTERGKHVLKIEDALRSDTGQFTIALKNPNGECASTATVTVVDRPAPPEGPLQIYDINKEGCTVEFKHPKDDGGEPITDFIIEAQDMDEKGKFVQVGRVNGAETKCVIKGLRHKGNYKLRVKVQFTL